MSQCHVCTHPSVATIDTLLEAGRSARSLAREFGLGYESVKRHNRNHGPMRGRPRTDTPSTAPTGGDPLVVLVESLRVRAEKTSNPGMVREYRLALLAQQAARATAPLECPPLAESDEWKEFREVLVKVLEPFPDAEAAVRVAIGKMVERD